MIKLLSIILFLILNTQVSGQVLQNGLIMPKQTEREGICCVYAPEKGFSVYNKPGGEKIGILTRNIDQNYGGESYYQIYLVDGKTKKASQIELDNFQEIGYQIWAITYFERRSGFVRIINGKYNYWLNEREIDKQGFKLTEWQDFLSENTGYLMGYYAKTPGLNLREGPDTDSKIIRALRGVTNQIMPTREHTGPWTKVKVIIHKENPCRTNLAEDNNIQQELEGWIKIVDDNGRPNVWYNAEGC